MRFTRIEGHHHALAFRINLHVLHARNLAEWFAQFPHAFVTILAFGGDYDFFDDFVIGLFRIKRIGRVWIVWSRWVHESL